MLTGDWNTQGIQFTLNIAKPKQQTISLKAAKAAGLAHYYTGKPCKYGHDAPRTTSNGNCVVCLKENSVKRLAKKREEYALKKQTERKEYLASLQIISFQEAVQRSLPRYFTGVACSNGHVAERYVNGDHCVECHRINAKNDRDRKKAGNSANTISTSAGRPAKAIPPGAQLAQGEFHILVSQKQARLLGLPQYFDSEPCRYGHLSPRFTKSGACVQCTRKTDITAEFVVQELRWEQIMTIVLQDTNRWAWPIVARDEAISAGSKRFFVGDICKNGLVAEQYAGNGECVVCSAERNRARYATDPLVRQRNIRSAAEWNRSDYGRERRNARARVKYKTREFLDKILWRIKNDVLFAEVNRIKTLLRNTLKKKSGRKAARLESILGCTKVEFIRHIERQFLPGMS